MNLTPLSPGVAYAAAILSSCQSKLAEQHVTAAVFYGNNGKALGEADVAALAEVINANPRLEKERPALLKDLAVKPNAFPKFRRRDKVLTPVPWGGGVVLGLIFNQQRSPEGTTYSFDYCVTFRDGSAHTFHEADLQPGII